MCMAYKMHEREREWENQISDNDDLNSWWYSHSNDAELKSIDF